MSKPMRTNNPSEWNALDGIYIDDLRPPGRVTGQGSAVVAIVGQFEMGPYQPTVIQSSGHLISLFGAGDHKGYKSLIGKSFANLVVARVKTDTAKTAFAVLNDPSSIPAASVRAEALWDGAYGNVIKVKSLVSTSGVAEQFNILVTFGSRTQLFENLTLAALPITGTFCKLSKEDGATLIPALDQELSFTQGSDGTVTAADYLEALAELESYDGVTIVFTDWGTQDVNLALIDHCNRMGDRYPILFLTEGTSKAAAKLAASDYRSAMDRGSFVFPHLYQYNPNTDKTELSNPAAYAASVLSQIPEEYDPAIADAAKFLTTIKGLEFNLSRTDYIELKNAGIMAFEFDKDLGYKIKSGVTLSLDPALTMVFRRRMSDKITNEAASALKPYQNKPNNGHNKTDILGTLTRYLQDLQDFDRIEKYLVDGDSMNTESTIANGEYHVLIYVKLYSSMRYIVLHAQIGESVLITERSAA